MQICHRNRRRTNLKSTISNLQLTQARFWLRKFRSWYIRLQELHTWLRVHYEFFVAGWHDNGVALRKCHCLGTSTLKHCLALNSHQDLNRILARARIECLRL